MSGARMRYEKMNVPKIVEVIPIPKKSLRRICNPKSNPEIGERFLISSPLYSFGPFYPESESSADAKDRAWKKIIEEEEVYVNKKKMEKKNNNNNTTQNYMAAIRKVEKEARATYGGDAALDHLTESEFRWMMIKDGCFFLQLTLHLLNDSGELKLGYPEEDPNFGKRSPKIFMGFIKSMFLLGNQIPLVVLKELMNQIYFRDVIDGVKWWVRPSDMLSKQILYDLLLDPVIPNGRSVSTTRFGRSILSGVWNKVFDGARFFSWWSIHAEKPRFYSSNLEKPSDLLHGLQLFLLGQPVNDGKSTFLALLHGLRLFFLGRRPAHHRKSDSLDNDSGGGDERLLEEELEDGDLEAGIKLKSSANANIYKAETKDGYFNNDFYKFFAIKEELENKKKLSASNLGSKGICLWNYTRGEGSRGISFKSRYFWGSLFMPFLKLNHDTNVLFTNLKYYEILHQQKEIRSYINFLANLVSTYEDVNALASSKIIDDNNNSDNKQRFLDMLGNLSDKEVVFITPRHHSIIGRVKDYSTFPWEYFKYVAVIVFALTIIQSVFGVLSWDVGKQQLHQAASSSGA